MNRSLETVGLSWGGANLRFLHFFPFGYYVAGTPNIIWPASGRVKKITFKGSTLAAFNLTESLRIYDTKMLSGRPIFRFAHSTGTLAAISPVSAPRHHPYTYIAGATEQVYAVAQADTSDVAFALSNDTVVWSAGGEGEHEVTAALAQDGYTSKLEGASFEMDCPCDGGMMIRLERPADVNIRVEIGVTAEVWTRGYARSQNLTRGALSL